MVTTAIDDLGQKLSKLSTELRTAQVDARNLRDQVDMLAALYRRAGAEVRTRAASDVRRIEDSRIEAERIVQSLRGSSLFGRYAADARTHQNAANRWRASAVCVLIFTTSLEIFLAVGPLAIAGWPLAAPVFPMLLLFAYASAESRNHRRVELNRRRIYLRMAAIESYTQSTPGGVVLGDLGDIMHRFIEKHFIEPDLDATDVESVVAWRPVLHGKSPKPADGRDRASKDRNGRGPES